MGNAKFLSRALLLAECSEHKNFKHGAVLVKSGKILSEGSNKYTNTGKIHGFGSIHAEESALRSIKKDAKGGTMYIARSASYGPAMSKPCYRCQLVLRNAGIKRVIYTTSICGRMEDMYL
jgi:deoxycytidylate deaminase